MPSPTFHLGLTMAGAVSGGAYTAGVMDYLFETLDKWQEIKDALKKNEEGKPLTVSEQPLVNEFKGKIPTHDVVIDVMGGASAGGMTSSMTMLAAFQKFAAIREKLPTGHLTRTGNIFYDSWVMLLDVAERQTIEKLLDTTDIEREGLQSVLNSDVVDEIAGQAFKGIEGINPSEKRKYFSSNLELILTLCSLTGLPLKINFSSHSSRKKFDRVPGHQMQYHALKAHFRLGEADSINYLPLDFKSAKDVALWKLCSIATGAFPFGLKYRNITLPGDYVRCDIERSVLGNGNHAPLEWPTDFPDKFEFTAVDGGTLDNEPFGAVKNVLENIAPKTSNGHSNYGIVMIDPFPNFEEEAQWLSKVKSLFDVMPNLYGTLRHQAMFKQSDFTEIVKSDYPRFEIFPSKYIAGRSDAKWEKLKYPLACGSVGAFGGFFHYKFREHDYFLGRDNCKYFLRYYFCFEHDPQRPHPIHENWTQEMLNSYMVRRKNEEKIEKNYLPIIPDPDIIGQNINLNQKSKTPQYTIPDLPKISLSEILKYRSQIKLRAGAVIDKAARQLLNADQQKKWWHPMIIFLAKFFGSGRVTDKILNSILNDLRCRGLS